MYATLVAYVTYLIVSIVLTVWVARTLFRNGRVFLVDTFHGNETLADSVNHLLVVGFYLINLGFVTYALRFGAKPQDPVATIEYLSMKLGLVMLVLGVMHMVNIKVFSSMRSRALSSRGLPTYAAPRAAASELVAKGHSLGNTPA